LLFSLHSPAPTCIYSLSYTTLFRSPHRMHVPGLETHPPLPPRRRPTPGFPRPSASLLLSILLVRVRHEGGRRQLLAVPPSSALRSEEHTSELQSRENLVCRLLLEKK